MTAIAPRRSISPFQRAVSGATLALLGLVPTAVAQARIPARPAPAGLPGAALQERSQVPQRDRLSTLASRLQVGRDALAELGRADLVAELDEILAGMRRRRAAAGAATDRAPARDGLPGRVTDRAPDRVRDGVPGPDAIDYESIEHRLAITRRALRATNAAGDEAAAGVLEHAVKNLQLRVDGAPVEQINESARGFDPERLLDALRRAARRHAAAGRRADALATRGLVEYYPRRWGWDSGGEEVIEEEAPPRRERAAANGLEDLGRRLDVLRIARKGLAEHGHAESAAIVERGIHLGELQLEGKTGPDFARLAGEFEPEALLREIRRAARLYREADAPDRAEMCANLARFYAEHWRIEDGRWILDREVERAEHEEGDEHEARTDRAEDRGAAERREAEALRRESDRIRREAQALSRESVELHRRAEEERREAEEGARRRALEEKVRGHVEAREAERAAAEKAEAREKKTQALLERMEERAARLKILLVAARAWDDGDEGEQAQTMRRVVRLAELQMKGAPPEQIGEAAHGLTQQDIIDSVARAAKRHEHEGDAESAHLCGVLHRFYVEREAAREKARREAEERAALERAGESGDR